MEDRELLQQFVRDRSQKAFQQLVARHSAWLYSACLRRLGDPSLAEDATQAVFMALARRPPNLVGARTLGPWLHRAAKYVSNNLNRARKRRIRHETEAATMSAQPSDSLDAAWQAIESELEPALDQLSPQEREIVLLRFYEKNSHYQIAARLSISGSAAQKRLSRALTRLRDVLLRSKSGKGGAAGLLSAAVLERSLDARCVVPLPHTVTAALSRLSPAGSSEFQPLAEAILRAAALAKMKIAAIAAAIAVAIAVPAWMVLSRAADTHPVVANTGNGSTVFDPDAFNALSNWDRLQFVILKLKERDRQLENIAFKVDDTLTNPNPDGTRTPMRKSHYELRRLQSRIWMREQGGAWQRLDETDSDSVFAWDAATRRATVIINYNRSFDRAFVGNSSPQQIAAMTFNRIIGLRIDDLHATDPSTLELKYEFSGTLSEWIASLMDREAPFTVLLEPDNQTIKVEFKELRVSHSVQTIWISTAKGYMPSKMEDRLLGGNESYASALFTVAAAEKHDGVWLPQQVLREQTRGNTTDKILDQNHLFEAHDFQLGKMTRNDVVITLPINTTVTDTGRKIRYAINPDNTFTLLEFTRSVRADPSQAIFPFNTEIRTPPENAVVRQIDDSTAALYTTSTRPDH